MSKLIWRITELVFPCVVMAIILAPAFVGRREYPKEPRVDDTPVTVFVKLGTTHSLSKYFPSLKDPRRSRPLDLSSTTPDAFKIDQERDEITFVQPGIPALCNMEVGRCKVFAVE